MRPSGEVAFVLVTCAHPAAVPVPARLRTVCHVLTLYKGISHGMRYSVVMFVTRLNGSPLCPENSESRYI